jgi:hypothetical protein
VGTARSVRGGVRVPIRCSSRSGGCRISIRLSRGARSRAIGSLRVRLVQGQHRTLTVPLSSAGKRLAAHHAVVALTVTGTVIGVLEALLSKQQVRL